LTAAEEERVEQLLSLDWDPLTVETPYAPGHADALRIADIDRQLALGLGADDEAAAPDLREPATPMLSVASPPPSRLPVTPILSGPAAVAAVAAAVAKAHQPGYGLSRETDYLRELRERKEQDQRNRMMDDIDAALVALHVSKVCCCCCLGSLFGCADVGM
jgi:hypothetical protein